MRQVHRCSAVRERQVQKQRGFMPTAAHYLIAPAALEDVAALRDLAEVCWRATYGDIYTPDFISGFLARAYSELGLRHAITDPANCFLLAKRGETPVGFGQVGPAFHAGNGPMLTQVDLHRLYLHPAHQRRGLGRRLLETLEAWIRAAGHDRYGCYVHSRNTPAQAFYAALGFVHYPGRDTHDELYLVKSLA